MSSDEDSPSEGREKFTIERSSSDVQTKSPEEDEDFFGPALPPHLLGKKEETNKLIGPVMPSYLSKKPEENTGAEEQNVIGPQIPDHLKSQQSETKMEETHSEVDNNDNDNDFGPSPHLMATGDTSAYYRAIGHQKSKVEEEAETSAKRESWMLELPEEKAAKFGLGPRQFRTRVPTDKERDSSVWTDTPADKEKKRHKPKEKDHKEELKLKRLEERDKEMEKLAKKAAKKLKKDKSLLEIHIKNMKKKKKKEAKKEKQDKKGKAEKIERRPFDRDIDLQVHRFDESQRRAILNKSKFLNDRFAAGESRYL